MLFVYLSPTLLFALGSCSIIFSSNLPQEPFLEVIEGTSPPLQDTLIGELKNSITEELRKHHNHFLGKLESLSAACRPSKSIPEGEFTYNVSTHTFRDPRINLLVKVMTKKLQAIAEITMDDLEEKLQSFRLVVTQHILDKFSPLLSEIADLQNQVKNLANKKALTQISSGVADVILSKSNGVSTALSSRATKNELITKSSHLLELSEGIQRKIEALKLCENSPAVDSALEMSNKLNEDLARIKESLRILSHRKDDAASTDTAAVLLQEITSMAEKNGIVGMALSSLATDLAHAFARILVRLNETFEEIANGVNSFSFTPVTEEVTETKQTRQLTGDVEGTVTPRPCLDSQLNGPGRSLDICGAAVRFRKCYLNIVAFHCCRSCMDAGLISTAPSISSSRNLSLLKALTFLKPS